MRRHQRRFKRSSRAGSRADRCSLDRRHAVFSQVNPIPVKAALSMMGLIHDFLRLPLTPLEDPYREKLRLALQKLNLIP